MTKKLDYRREHFRMKLWKSSDSKTGSPQSINPEKHPRRLRAMKAKRASSMYDK